MTNKIISLVIIYLFIATSAYAGTLLFSDNFDDGNANGWTTTSNVSVSTDQAASGSYSLKCVHDATVAAYANLGSAVQNQKEITVKYKWFTASSWVNGTGVKYLRLIMTGQNIQWENWFSQSFGNEPLSIGGAIYGNDNDGTCTRKGAIYGAEQSYNKGSWMDIRVHYILNDAGSSNGSFEIYFNDILKDNGTGIVFRCSNSSWYNLFYIPSNIGTANANCINYIDDVEIWAGTPDGSDTTAPAVNVIMQGVGFGAGN